MIDTTDILPDYAQENGVDAGKEEKRYNDRHDAATRDAAGNED
jgi:hypothetical protein